MTVKVINIYIPTYDKFNFFVYNEFKKESNFLRKYLYFPVGDL